MSEKSKKKDIHQLRKLDFDLANYFSNTIIPQLFVDADMKLRIFTPPAMKQFALTYDDIGKDIGDVKDNIRYPTIVENIEEVMSSGKIFEKEIQTTDGKWFQMNVIPYVEHEENLINGVIVTFVDITKRLATIRELERVNAEHNVIMFALSHDIKQPISTLMLLSNGLEEIYKRQDPKQFQEWVERLKKASKGLNTMIDEITSNNSQGSPAEKNLLNQQNLEDVCLTVLDALREEIKSKKISIQKDFKTSTVNFPKNKLRSIVYNLLHNAIKFRDPKKDSFIQISTSSIEGFVILSISDNGLGIAKEDQEKIFEKSSRVNEEIEGTGMGLYIIKKMMEIQNGRIELESNQGTGSQFIVYFKTETEEV